MADSNSIQESKDEAGAYTKPHLEAYHINQLISKHKVIITDWCNPKSIRPDLDDPQFPVKSLIYIIEDDEFRKSLTPASIKHLSTINEFVKDRDLTLLGGFIHETPIHYSNPQENGLFRRTSAISIAFAGKQVKSSMKVFKKYTDETRFTTGILKFKKSLDFPTDDNRVLGFMFLNDSMGVYGTCEQFMDKLLDTFTSVKFVKIRMKRSNFPLGSLAICLIRI